MVVSSQNTTQQHEVGGQDQAEHRRGEQGEQQYGAAGVAVAQVLRQRRHDQRAHAEDQDGEQGRQAVQAQRELDAQARHPRHRLLDHTTGQHLPGVHQQQPRADEEGRQPADTRPTGPSQRASSGADTAATVITSIADISTVHTPGV